MKIEEIPQFREAMSVLENSTISNAQIQHSKEVAEILLQHDGERLALIGMLHALPALEIRQDVFPRLDLSASEQAALMRLSLPMRDPYARMDFLAKNAISYAIKRRCLKHRCRFSTSDEERRHCSDLLSLLESSRILQNEIRQGKAFTR